MNEILINTEEGPSWENQASTYHVESLILLVKALLDESDIDSSLIYEDESTVRRELQIKGLLNE